jgi:secreted trypsin-like serine protease
MFVRNYVGARLWVTLLATLAAVAASLVVSLHWGEPAGAETNPSTGGFKELRTDFEWEEVEEPTRSPQIVGGTAVPDGKYPFIAHVRLYDGFSEFRCTGTLIDANSVLTAAHCLEGVVAARVILNRAAISNTAQGQVRDVSAAISHRFYRGSNVNYAYDAAMLQLASPVTGIRPAVVANARMDRLETPGRYATTAGWGTTFEGGRAPDRMREVRVPIRADSYARRAYNATGVPSVRYFPSIMLAAGQRGKDSCQGDSGGPLFVPVGPHRVQIGITSFGVGCARAAYPGVYTEVNSTPVRNFIVNASRQNNG